MKQFNVLITSTGTVTAQSVIKGLRCQDEYKVNIFGVDMEAANVGRYFCDYFFQVPSARSDNYIDCLFNICETHKIDLVIPILDCELLKWSQNTGRFFEKLGCRVVVSGSDAINICNSKRESVNFFHGIGIGAPRNYNLSDIGQGAGNFPLFIKPDDGISTRDAYKINNREELQRYLGVVKNPVIQEFIEGEEYTIDTISDFDGQAIAVVPRRRLETRIGISYKGCTVYDQGLIDGAKKIAAALKIIGPSNIQCFRNSKGVYFFEINPRFAGTLVLTIAAGVNSPLILLKLLDGKIASSKDSLLPFKEGVYLYRYWNEVFTDQSGNRLNVYDRML